MSNIRSTASRAVAMVSAAVCSGVLSAILVVPAPVRAADIDLFLSNSGEAHAPNVYVMIDNSANWTSTIQDDAGNDTTKKTMEHQALEAVFTDPAIAGTSDPDDDDPIEVRVGFGLFANGNSPRGGKVYRAVQDLTPAYQSDIASMLYDDSGQENLPKANNAPYALSFNEAHAYFAGSAPVSGTQDGDHDPDATVSSNDGTKSYISPAAGNCGKNYVVLIGNGEPDSGEDNDAESKLYDHGGRLDSDPIEVNPDNFEANWADEYARFMDGGKVVPDDVRGDHEQNVRTYVIDVHDPDSKQADNNKFKAARAWLYSIAQQGGGSYYAVESADGIQAALEQILAELFAVDSVFAASSLPVSVNVRGTNLNQVYMGVFRPDDMGRTRWQGNLKLYQLALSGNDAVILADKNGDAAQGDSGFILNTAESFWTEPSSYWAFDPRGSTATPESDLPDGDVVEKGGVHQQIRIQHASDPATTRTLYTYSGDCTSPDGCALGDFDIGHPAVSSASLGTADSTEAADLVDWMHGANNVEDAVGVNDPDTLPQDGAAAIIRPSVHGDVLHSRPAVINYGNGEVIAFYGGNDGIFHAVRGGMGTGGGQELWGFIPEEFFPRLKPLRDLADGKEYFADGGIGIYRADQDDDGVIEPLDDEVYLYVSMRRGGRLLYALDVSDPDSPKLLWKRDDGDDGFSELGQTWSHPGVSRVRWYDANGDPVAKDVLIFGGGYDPAADDPNMSGTRSMGRGIFVVDAMTGDLIWQAGSEPGDAGSSSVYHDVPSMSYSIPSDVTVLDRDEDGFHDRVYVGDTGGQVWRVDLSGAPGAWQVHKLASDGIAASQPERKFLYPPDVVYKNEPGGERYDAVLLGSGDRAAPFKKSVTNRFYMFKDDYHVTLTDGTTTITEAELFDATDNVIQVGSSEAERDTASNELANARGWYIDLEAGMGADGVATGEKVVSGAVTLGGTTYFNTSEPPDESDTNCSQALGIARNYELRFDNATATTENNQKDGLQTGDRYSKADGGGFPPSPVSVMVEIDGELHEVVLSGTEAKTPPGTGMGRRNPVYWSREIDG